MLRRCLALLLAAVLVAAGSASVAEGAKRKAENPRLHAFRSCSNLLTYAQRNGARVIRDTPLGPTVPPPRSAPGPGQDDSGAGGEGGGGMPVSGRQGADESPTNVQEEGVDEPDWVKASGSTLLVATGNRLRALDAATTPPAKLDSLKLGSDTGDLLVHGNRALLITQPAFGSADVGTSQAGGGVVPPREWLGRTRLIEVDISNPRALEVVRTYDVEGSYTSARLTGSTARIVVRTEARGIELPGTPAGISPSVLRKRWLRAVRRSRTRAWLPAGVLRDRRTGKAKRRAVVRCRQVRRSKRFSGLGSITVLTIDMTRGLPAVDADALMTDGDTVYASPERLYVASERWLGADPSRRELRDESATGLHAFSTETGGETGYVASGEVPGYLLSQWSLSEHGGVLRVATTSMPPWEARASSASAVRTLEEREGRLSQIGVVGGLGEGERIYAVRFMGDTGYVVTFRQTDPLYVLALGDPRAPRKVGELKVPGYSAYLHPVGDGLLLGVGQDADERGRTRGVQLSLFDVSDPANPARLDREALGEDTYSQVEDDHHAFTWWAPGKLAVIPVLGFSRGGEESYSGAAAFRVDRAGGIQRAAMIDAGRGDFSRSLVLGDRLLLVSGQGLLSTPAAAPGPGAFTAF